jgi:enolase
VSGPAYAEKRTADVLAGTYPTTVVDLSRCGSVQAATQLLHSTAAAGTSAVAVLVGTAAGEAQSAAHLVDLAVAGRAAYLMTCSGPLSATTMAVGTRLASVMAELITTQTAAPRAPFTTFNRHDLMPLPEVDVAPIRHKGDKKKDTRKVSAKKK